ncbi:ABC transporter permease subunit [Agromyces tropicus]|uniref:ABC transporter permease subunit n=1 Tax=Agromyces tropicus TaxID=555371 RepID=A0ABP5GA56_9MICO
MAYLYVLPALSASLLFVAFPLLQTVWYSLHRWSGIGTPVWVGLQNYVTQLSSPRVQSALYHSLILIVFFALIPVCLGLITASMLSSSRLRGLGFFRTVLFLPQVIALTVTGMAWRWMYNLDGPINETLRAIGLDSLARPWLGDFDWALYAVGLVGTWLTAGFCMILFLAGISRIDPGLYDAAKIDGSGPIREFFAVTLPGVKPELGVALTITVIGGLKSFDVVYMTTRGGPGTSTTVPALEIYRLAFVDGQVGSAAAIAIVLVLLIVIVGLGMARLFRTRQ